MYFLHTRMPFTRFAKLSGRELKTEKKKMVDRGKRRKWWTGVRGEFTTAALLRTKLRTQQPVGARMRITNFPLFPLLVFAGFRLLVAFFRFVPWCLSATLLLLVFPSPFRSWLCTLSFTHVRWLSLSFHSFSFHSFSRLLVFFSDQTIIGSSATNSSFSRFSDCGRTLCRRCRSSYVYFFVFEFSCGISSTFCQYCFFDLNFFHPKFLFEVE